MLERYIKNKPKEEEEREVEETDRGTDKEEEEEGEGAGSKATIKCFLVYMHFHHSYQSTLSHKNSIP